MRKIYVAFLLMVFAAFGLQAQTTLFEDNFDSYTVGGQLADQGGDPWTTWSDTPGSAEDPVISDAQSVSPSNSVNILAGNDCVLLLGDKTEGRYKITFQIYIPDGKIAYYNVLQAFAGADSEWGTQVFFDTDGYGHIDAGAESAATFDYNYDEWILIENYIDLDNDWAEVFVAGEYLVGWQWTLGTFGTPGPLQLGAVNIYAWDETGTPDYFIDDMLYEAMPLLDPPSNLTATVDGNMVDLEWDAPTRALDSYYVYRNNLLLGTTEETTFSDEIAFPGDYTYAVKAYYIPNGLSDFSNEVDVMVEGGVERAKVLLEIATGTWCFYCPGSAMGADDLYEGDFDVAVIEFHIGDTWENVYAGDRDAYYGVSGYPTAFFDGIVDVVGGSNTESMFDTYFPVYQTRMGIPSLYDLEVDVIYNRGSYSFTVDVMLEQLWTYSSTDMVLQLALTESHLPEVWYDLDEVNFVLREMYPDAAGTTVTLADIGDTEEFNFEIEVPDTYDIENCQLVVYLQDNDTKEVMNSDMVKLGQVVDIAEVGETYSAMYPNPATDRLTIESESTIKTISIFNLAGQKVYEIAMDQEKVDLNIDFLETGIYMVRLETEIGTKVEKLNVR